MKVILDLKDEKASTYKSDVLEGIKEAMEEVKLIKQGSLKGIPAKELLDEISE